MTEVAGGPHDAVGFLLAQLGTVTARRFREVLTPLGIEPRQFAVLRLVAQSEGQSQQALGDSLHIAPSQMVSLVDELEQRGLVERRANPSDRRVRALHVTAAGRKTLAAAGRLAMEHETRLCEPLQPGERQALIAMLQRLAAAQGLHPGVHPGLDHGS
ncbi:MAG TPA: MarR family transcriptional regulator [Acidimicrobiales bacterium]|nr:MarR family transcriptional regulator [Acidimicrobiales bacterium]